MIDIPVCWLSYTLRSAPKGRWDQLFLERLINGEEGRPPYGYRFVDAPEPPESGGVVVFPAGTYAEHDQVERAVEMLLEDLNDMAWCVLIATSDEEQSFPWGEIDLPAHVKLWVMLPKTSIVYPPGTRFIGEGSPVAGKTICEHAAFTRDLDLMLVAQGGHIRRTQAFEAARSVRPGLKVKVEKTAGFTQGMTQEEYLFHLTRSWIAPAPSGIVSQSSFRAYEALEAGCIPILDEQNPAGESGFWEMLGLNKVAPMIRYWRDLPSMTDSLLNNRLETAAMCSSRWQQHKRRMLQWLHDDCPWVESASTGPWDDITVIIPTSPVPSNPDISMIQQTVASIRSELPGAEILITCDGIRDEQLDRADDYHFFLHRLCMWTNTQFNVWPFIHPEHLHQSGMARLALNEVRTPYVMYVEHDCPLEGVIDFAGVLSEMQRANINHMRFLHEVCVLPDHAHLFLETEPVDGNRFVRTVQYSNRPFVATTDWFRRTIATYFGPESRTMLEDSLHGVWQHHLRPPYADRIRLQALWEQHRGAVWADGPNLKHSGHLDGRAGDPKYSMTFSYSTEEVPDGAPQPGTR